MRIPLPGYSGANAIVVAVLPLTGLIDITESDLAPSPVKDNPADDTQSAMRRPGDRSRQVRLRLATTAINDNRARLLEDLTKLIVAGVMESVEAQLQRLGWSVVRRLPLRAQGKPDRQTTADLVDLMTSTLHPGTTVNAVLRSAPDAYLSIQYAAAGLTYSIVKLIQVETYNAIGTRYVVCEHTALDLAAIGIVNQTQAVAVPPSDSEISASSGSKSVFSFWR